MKIISNPIRTTFPALAWNQELKSCDARFELSLRYRLYNASFHGTFKWWWEKLLALDLRSYLSLVAIFLMILLIGLKRNQSFIKSCFLRKKTKNIGKNDVCFNEMLILLANFIIRKNLEWVQKWPINYTTILPYDQNADLLENCTIV